MTRAEIAAELRRSACEDADPWEVEHEAFLEVLDYIQVGELIVRMAPTAMRILYLLVAEAIND